MKRQISVFLSAMFFLLSSARAQTDLTMSGVVIENGTGNPVEGATVSIVGGKANQDVTDSAGKFSLRFAGDTKPGTKVRIRVVKDGYKPYTNDIAVSSELSVPISLKRLIRVNSPSSVKPPEELQGRLLPSNEATPPNYCNEVINGSGILILMGFVTSYVDQFPHTVLMVDDTPRLVVHKESDGTIWLSLDIFGADGKIIASLDEDGFTVRPGSYFKMTRKDKSSLRIVDEYNEEVLNVRYVNPQAIWFNALLRYPGSNPVSLKGSAGGGICTAHAFSAEINLRTRPQAQESKPPQVNAPNGIAIGGGNVFNPTVINVGPALPTLTFELFDKPPLPDSTAPQQWIRITIDRTFHDPKFAVVCDRPCRVLKADVVFGPNGGMKQVSWGKIPNNENIAVVSVNQPNPMPSEDRVEVVIASEDDKPVNILGVKTLTIAPAKQ